MTCAHELHATGRLLERDEGEANTMLSRWAVISKRSSDAHAPRLQFGLIQVLSCAEFLVSGLIKTMF